MVILDTKLASFSKQGRMAWFELSLSSAACYWVKKPHTTYIQGEGTEIFPSDLNDVTGILLKCHTDGWTKLRALLLKIHSAG